MRKGSTDAPGLAAPLPGDWVEAREADEDALTRWHGKSCNPPE